MEKADMEKLRDDLKWADNVLWSVLVVMKCSDTPETVRVVKELKSRLNGHRKRIDARLEEIESPPPEGQGAGD